MAKDVYARQFLDVAAPQFYVQELELTPGQEIIIETDAAPNTDEVLHLLLFGRRYEAEREESWFQVASNDNYAVSRFFVPSPIRCGGNFTPTARIKYKYSGRSTARALLIVRAKDTNAGGQARLCFNGSFLTRIVPVGGVILNNMSVTVPASRTRLFPQEALAYLHAVPQPNESEWPVTMAFSDADGLQMTRFGWDGGAAGATVLKILNQQNRRYFVGTPHFEALIAGKSFIARTGRTRIYVNDRIDTDGDGLGDLLEQELELCSNFENLNVPAKENPCSYVADTDGDDLDDLPDGPKDTDRDGIPDGEELLGYLGDPSDPTDDVGFPRAGAHPRYKDIFLVLAWFHDLELNRIDIDPISFISSNHFAGIVDNILPVYEAAPASHVHSLPTLPLDSHKKPLNLHIDYGLDSKLLPGREHISGVLSSKVVRQITPSFLIVIKGKIENQLCFQINGIPACVPDVSNKTPLQIAKSISELVDGTFNRLLHQPVYVAQIVCNNVIFRKEHLNNIEETRYFERCDAESTQVEVKIDTSIPGVYFERDLIFDSNEEDVEIGLDYHSNYIFEEAYIPRYLAQRVRYGVITTGDGQNPGRVPFYQGRLMAQFGDPTSQGSIDFITETIAHELGHTLGIEHWGHYSWYFYDEYRLRGQGGQAFLDELAIQDNVGLSHTRGNDLNYIPFYKSIMNYAFGDIGIQTGFYHHVSEDIISFNPSKINDINEINLDYSPIGTNLYEGPPWHLKVGFVESLLSVDWNRDGIIANHVQPYNVSLMWEYAALFGTVGKQNLNNQDNNEKNYMQTADIVRSPHPSILLPNDPGFIYAFYIEKSDDLSEPSVMYYQYAHLGYPDQASCAITDDPLQYPFSNPASTKEGCLAWSEPIELAEERFSSGVSAAWLDGQLFVATTRNEITPFGTIPEILVHVYQPSNNGILNRVGKYVYLASTKGKVELARIYAHPTNVWRERLTLVYNDWLTNEYKAYYWSGDDFVVWPNFSNARQFDNTQHQISGLGNPSLASWPDPYNRVALFNESVDPSTTQRVTCGVFPSINNALRIYCFDPDPSRLEWRDITHFVFINRVGGTSGTSCRPHEFFEITSALFFQGICLPVTVSPPELSMRYIRFTDGSPSDLANVSSHFQLTYLAADANPSDTNPDNLADVWLSTPLHMLTSHPLSSNWQFDNQSDIDVWRGNFIVESPIESGTNVPMYDDSTMGSIFALGSLGNGFVQFFPHADASPNLNFWIGSDFRVMEDHVCEQHSDASNNFFTDSDNRQRIVIMPVVSCGRINVFE